MITNKPIQKSFTLNDSSVYHLGNGNGDFLDSL